MHLTHSLLLKLTSWNKLPCHGNDSKHACGQPLCEGGVGVVVVLLLSYSTICFAVHFPGSSLKPRETLKLLRKRSHPNLLPGASLLFGKEGKSSHPTPGRSLLLSISFSVPVSVLIEDFSFESSQNDRLGHSSALQSPIFLWNRLIHDAVIQ